MSAVGALVWEGDHERLRRVFLLGDPLTQFGCQPASSPDDECWYRHVHAADRERVMQVCRDVARDRVRRTAEYRLVSDDGRTHWCSDVIAAIDGPDGAVRLRGLTVDVSDSHREASGTMSREAFEQAQRLARIGHFTQDIARDSIVYSPQVEAMLGVAAGVEHPMAGFFALVHPDDRELVARVPAMLRASGENEFDVEYRILPPAGGTVHVRAIGYLVRDAGGRGVQVFGTLQDVTEEKREESERRAHLWFLNGLREIDGTLRSSQDLDRIMADLCETVRQVLACDQVWLLDSTDDEGTAWRLAASAGAPGAGPAVDASVLRDAGVAACLAAIRAASVPVQRGPDAARDVPHLLHATLHARSLLGTSVLPRGGTPLVLLAIQCSKSRSWTAVEAQLLEQIGRRLADTAVTVASYAKLRDSESRLAESQRIARVGYWERDSVTNRMHVSDETLRILGAPQCTEYSDDLPNCEERWSRLVHPDDRARVGAALQAARRGLAPYNVEYRMHRLDGELRDVRSIGTIVRDDAGTPVRMFGTLQDITDLRRAERELHDAETRFRNLVDHASDAFFVFRDDEIVDVNEQAVAQLGYAREELIGMKVAGFDDDVMDGQTFEPPSVDGGRVATFERRHRRKDGTVYPVEVRVREYRHAGQRYVMCLARDISDRIEHERRLRDNHALMEAIIGGSPDIMYVVDRQHRCVMINSTGATLLEKSVEEMIGRPSREVYPHRFADQHIASDEEVMRTGQPQVIEGHSVFNGVRRNFTTSKYPHRNPAGEIIGMIGVTREMSDYKRLEEQLVHSQKMEAVGQLAGGVAHDFNNLLTVIISYSELLFSGLRVDDPNRELVSEVRRGAERAATLTSQLLTFSRKQRLSPRVVNLYAGIGEWRRLVRPLVREDIAIAVHMAPELHAVHVDPDQFEQALTNLVVNARDAMPDGGTLRVTVDEVTITTGTAPLHGGITPGRYARIAISDTGQGIADGVLARVFEPFFTTKAVGRGTGLGLSMVYGFVRQSGGHVAIESELGVGTTVSMFLPTVNASAERSPGPEAEVVDCGGTETVLLVEDERTVRTLSRRILEGAGYTVLEAFDGEEALAVARAHAGHIDIVVTDVVMPRLNGRRMATALRATDPSIKVLFVSGYAGDMTGDVDTIPVAQLLQKPFTPAALAQRVREVLDGPAPVPAT